MMKNGEYYACAVRREDGGIAVDKQRYVSLTDRYPLLRLPFVRGIFSFADSMILGMRALNWSAEIYAGGDESATEEEPSKFEAFLEKTFGEKAMKVMMGDRSWPFPSSLRSVFLCCCPCSSRGC